MDPISEWIKIKGWVYLTKDELTGQIRHSIDMTYGIYLTPNENSLINFNENSEIAKILNDINYHRDKRLLHHFWLNVVDIKSNQPEIRWAYSETGHKPFNQIKKKPEPTLSLEEYTKILPSFGDF